VLIKGYNIDALIGAVSLCFGQGKGAVIKRNSVWFAVALFATLFGLAGPAIVCAGSGPPVPSESYVLGFLAPGGDAGHLERTTEPFVGIFSGQPAGAFAEEVVRLINLERIARNLPPLRINAALADAAESHSARMRDLDCFDHQCPGEPSSAERACDAGYRPYGWGACYIGETIAAGFQDPASVVAAWLGSPRHRDVFLNGKFREIGVGYVDGGGYGHYWTVDLGSQPDVVPVFVNYGDTETDSREVTLILTNEEVSGWGGMDYALEIMISNDPSFAGAQWESYTPQKLWTLPGGNGPKTVYVKYRDPSGYEVVSTATIVLSEPPEYDLGLSRDSLLFIYQIGNGFCGSASGQVEIVNTASSSPMSWSAAGGAPWIGYEPGIGTTPGALVISVDSYETTAPGVSQAVITVSSLETPDSPKEVGVTVRAVDQIYRVMLPLVVASGR
jgi:uncharacterized protein YkwD